MALAQLVSRRRWPAAGAAVAVLVLATSVRAQSPGPPVFRSGIDLITVDVSVVDKAGKPVRSLTADQFEVSIDDRPRRVVSAELVEHGPVNVGDAPSRAVLRAFSSNELHEIPAAPGRLLFIAVDQASFSVAGVRDAAAAARRLIDRLEAHDRVGLVAFPAPGPTVAPSRDRRAILEALDRLVGSADSLNSASLGLSVSLTEALEIDARNDATLNRVSDRECRAINNRILPTCVESLRQEAQQVGMRAEQQSMRTLSGLRQLVDRLTTIDERKTLVLISAGLPVGERGTSRLDTRAETLAIARQAATANANIYVLHIDRSIVDAVSGSARRSNDTVLRDSSLWAAGLDQIASASGGTVFRVSTGTEQVIGRMLQETSASYVLGVEAGVTDRNFKPHAIKVSVRTPGVQVRSRREFVFGATPAVPDSPAGQLTAALRAPRVERSLPLAVATHTLGSAAAGGLRVLISANVGRAVGDGLDAQIGYVIADTSGRIVGSAHDTQRLTVAPSSPAGAASYVSLVGLAPGSYTLRLAVVDMQGRVGSVEHPFETGLADGEGLRMGDLLLLDPARPRDEMLAPSADGSLRGGAVDVYVELYPQPTGAGSIGISFGVAEAAEAAPLVQTYASVTRADAIGRSIGQARLDLARLPPGDYVAVALVTQGGRTVGRRHQALRIGGGGTNAPRGGA